MSKVTEKSIDRPLTRKKVRMLIRVRGHLIDKVSDAEKELLDVNQELYDLYEKLDIKSYKYKGKKYNVMQNDYYKWNFSGLRKFLRNKYGEKIANKIVKREKKIIESVDDDALKNLIDTKKPKAKEKLTNALGELVAVTHSKKFLRVFSN